MIRFGFVLSIVLAAIGLLVAGVVAGSLFLVDVSIGVAVLAAALLLCVVLMWRHNIFAAPAAADLTRADSITPVREAPSERPAPALAGAVPSGAKQAGTAQADTTKVDMAKVRTATAGPPKAGSAPVEVAESGVADGVEMASRASALRDRPTSTGRAKLAAKQEAAGEPSASATRSAAPGPAAAGPGAPAPAVPQSEAKTRTTAPPVPPPTRAAGEQATSQSERQSGRGRDDERATSRAKPAAPVDAARERAAEPNLKAGPTSPAREELAYRPSQFAVRAQERAAQRAALPADQGDREPGKPAQPSKPAEPPKPTPVSRSADVSTRAPAPEPVEAPKPARASMAAEAGEPAKAAKPAEPTGSPGDRAPDRSARPATEDEPRADDASGSVRVVPGIARYHRADCILIRFLAPDDLEVMTTQAATEGGCVPCKACQPDKSGAGASGG